MHTKHKTHKRRIHNNPNAASIRTDKATHTHLTYPQSPQPYHFRKQAKTLGQLGLKLYREWVLVLVLGKVLPLVPVLVLVWASTPCCRSLGSLVCSQGRLLDLQLSDEPAASAILQTKWRSTFFFFFKTCRWQGHYRSHNQIC